LFHESSGQAYKDKCSEDYVYSDINPVHFYFSAPAFSVLDNIIMLDYNNEKEAKVFVQLCQFNGGS